MRRKPLQDRVTSPAGPDEAASQAWWVLALAALVPLAILVVLYRLNVRLGMPGRFVYRYSPLVGLRLQAVPAALLLALGLGGGVWLLAAASAWHRRAGLGLICLAAAALACWTYFAPPEHLNQHTFNMHSPSQDGAFVLEALQIDDVTEYLRTFPQRAQSAPAEMRGTRVISNPPGATLLALAARRLVASCPPLHAYLRGRFKIDDPELDAFVESAAVGLLLCWLLTGLWLLSGLVLYALGRLFFTPVAAATFCLCCLVSPMTLLFTPGKDVAQLLTAALPLWLWFLAERRGWWWAAAAGAVFALSTMVSLVHIWLAGIVLAASLLDALHTPGRLRRLLLHRLLPAGAAAGLTAVGLYVVCGLNVIAATWAVARSQTAVTHGPAAMPFAWQLLGVPLFLLFAGPALWACGLWCGQRRAAGGQAPADARLGTYLTIVTAVVMLVTAGFTNLETPRLWIPFVPLLLLGITLQLPAFRQPDGRAARLLAALVVVQVICSALSWSLMDMRETEMRLSTGQFFWAPPQVRLGR